MHALCLFVAVLLGGWLGAPSTLPASQAAFPLKPVRGLDEFLPVADDNPLSAAKIALGRRLFFDALLSRDRSIACASCHLASRSFSDSIPRSRGVRGRAGIRNTPAIINRGYGASFFWDGRATPLEAQVLEPIGDTLEMDLSVPEAVARLLADDGYRAEFKAAFPDGVNAANLARALASYVRAIRSGDAPFDRYRDGDTSALSPEAHRGASLFFGRANCSACHVGPNFTDEKFHNTGIAAGTPDEGRYSVTHRPADRGAFKTPTLRDLRRTAPFMHDGSLRTLDDVVDFYSGGGRENPHLDHEIKPLRLDAAERSDLVVFLNALVSEAVTCAPVACTPPPPFERKPRR